MKKLIAAASLVLASGLVLTGCSSIGIGTHKVANSASYQDKLTSWGVPIPKGKLKELKLPTASASLSPSQQINKAQKVQTVTVVEAKNDVPNAQLWSAELIQNGYVKLINNTSGGGYTGTLSSSKDKIFVSVNASPITKTTTYTINKSE
jgi:hypothetical protein